MDYSLIYKHKTLFDKSYKKKNSWLKPKKYKYNKNMFGSSLNSLSNQNNMQIIKLQTNLSFDTETEQQTYNVLNGGHNTSYIQLQSLNGGNKDQHTDDPSQEQPDEHDTNNPTGPTDDQTDEHDNNKQTDAHDNNKQTDEPTGDNTDEHDNKPTDDPTDDQTDDNTVSVPLVESSCNEKPAIRKTYMIPRGSTLYHGSRELETFNTKPLIVGSGTYTTFFTFSKELAELEFGSCKPEPKKGYLHKFEVIKDINNIILSELYAQNYVGENGVSMAYDLDNINNNYCGNYINQFGQTFDAVAFKRGPDDDDASNTDLSKHSAVENIKIAICKPHEFLVYKSSKRCQYGSLSGEYSFAGEI